MQFIFSCDPLSSSLMMSHYIFRKLRVHSTTESFYILQEREKQIIQFSVISFFNVTVNDFAVVEGKLWSVHGELLREMKARNLFIYEMRGGRRKTKMPYSSMWSTMIEWSDGKSHSSVKSSPEDWINFQLIMKNLKLELLIFHNFRLY